MPGSKPLLIPGLTTALMLAVLVTLGVWQTQRLAWKTALLAEIERAERRPAVPLGADPPPFAKVRAEGVLRADLSVLYGAEGRDTPFGPRMGARLVSVLQRGNADALLVDRGWVEALPPASSSRAIIEGYVRPGETAGLFAASNDPASRRFYTLDPAAIGAALGLRRVAGYVLVALGATPPEGQPDPARTLPRPSNNHLTYAVTWFGLAAALLVIFIIYARKLPNDRI